MKRKKKQTDPELVGLLTAISIVSRRLAKNLADLEREERENYVCGSGKRPASGV